MHALGDGVSNSRINMRTPWRVYQTLDGWVPLQRWGSGARGLGQSLRTCVAQDIQAAQTMPLEHSVLSDPLCSNEGLPMVLTGTTPAQAETSSTGSSHEWLWGVCSAIVLYNCPDCSPS